MNGRTVESWSKIGASSLLVMALMVPVFLIGCGNTEAVKADSSDEDANTAIKVGDKITTKTEFSDRVDQRFKPMMQRFGINPQGDTIPPRLQQLRDRVKKQVARRIIVNQVLQNEAEKSGLAVSDAEVDERWNQLADRFPSEEALEERLRKAGKTKQGIRDQIRKNLLMRNFVEQRIGPLEVSEEEAEAYFEKNKKEYSTPEQVRARHILLRDDTGAESEIRSLKTKLDEGADFEEMAKKHSEGPSAEKGGDLGFFSREKMDPDFTEVAFNLDVGEVSDPVKTQFGYHLIKLIERKQAQPANYETSKGEVKKKLEQQKRQRKIKQLLSELIQRTQVTVSVPGIEKSDILSDLMG